MCWESITDKGSEVDLISHFKHEFNLFKTEYHSSHRRVKKNI